MENKEIRKQNLSYLIHKYTLDNPGKKKKDFAELCDTDPAVISQVLRVTTPEKQRNIGDKLARKIEASLGLRDGWMDSPNWIEDMLASQAGMSLEEAFDDQITNSECKIRIIGDAVLGADGVIDLLRDCSGWLRFYSSDKDAYAIKVSGDTLWPRVNSGEFIVVEPNTETHQGDEVFIRTVDGRCMIKLINHTRDGDFQLISINSQNRPVTMSADCVESYHFISAIVKSHLFIDKSQ